LYAIAAWSGTRSRCRSYTSSSFCRSSGFGRLDRLLLQRFDPRIQLAEDFLLRQVLHGQATAGTFDGGILVESSGEALLDPPASDDDHRDGVSEYLRAVHDVSHIR
tara:strand:- start:1742 stop:2059 length:318 start_codon:yes stop_codon:yes gene_type:complete